MIAKNRIKQIKSLQIKKYRNQEQLFCVEGLKSVGELLRSNLEIQEIFALEDWISINYNLFKNVKITPTSKDEIKKISVMETPPPVIAIVKIPKEKPLEIKNNELYLTLDSVRDPGNLGTILRIANWFGIKEIICSHDCTDIYNSKTIQASMGSAFRVNVYYKKLEEILPIFVEKNLPVYGTFLNGENIYTSNLASNGTIILGNEGHGITPETEKFITRKLLIPHFSTSDQAPESLNVSAAAAVVCSEFMRRKL